MDRPAASENQNIRERKSPLRSILRIYILPGGAITQFKKELQRGAPIQSFLPTVLGLEAVKTIGWVAGGEAIGNYLINRFYDLPF